MTKQYRVYFLNDSVITLSEEEMQQLVVQTSQRMTTELAFIVNINGGRRLFIRVENITYIDQEEIEGESGVVTPPSPAEIRAQKEAVVTNRPTDLGEQLANPNLGKETPGGGGQ